jgi:hypothetical protein
MSQKVLFFLFLFTYTTALFNIRILTMNRCKSLKRLLNSLNLGKTNIIINIEFFIDALPQNNSIDINTLSQIHNFQWNYGKKEIFINKRNFGLKNQWLRYYNKTEPLLILEDDMILCRSFLDLSIKALKYLKTLKNENIFGISFQKLRLILKSDNCKNFEPKKCLQKNVKKNHAFFLQQMATWAPIVFSHKWNELVKYYVNSKKSEKRIIHCIPGAISNLWYNTSGTFMQYFFQIKNFSMLYFNTDNHIAINMKEKGLHFKGKKEIFEDKCLTSMEAKQISFINVSFFDNGFNKFSNLLSPDLLYNDKPYKNMKEKCSIN